MPDHRFVTTAPGPAGDPPTAGQQRPADARARSSRPGAPTRAAANASEIVLRTWTDPVVDRRGHDPRSRYVEKFWLGVLGPSATWLVRRLADELAEADAESVRVDLTEMARSMGLTYSPGRSSPFAKAIQRCVMFDVAHHTGDGLAVRRRLPNVADRHLQRLPPSVGWEHDRWTDTAPRGSTDDHHRAMRLAAAMNEAGDCIGQIEGQLVAIGVTRALAAEVTAELRPGSAA